MAAILCNTFCVKPCEALSWCCIQCVKALTPVCGGLCRCCSDACEWFNRVFSEPFSCFLITALLWMGTVCLGAILALFRDFDGCSGPMMFWFIVSALEAVGHVIYAIYCFTRLHNRDKAFENYFMVLYQLVIHDPWTALYIIFDIFGFVWSIVGLSWNKNCPDEVSTIGTAVAYGLLFYIAVSYFAMISKLFIESVQNDICFCVFFIPFMMVPCCFGQSLRRSYERQQGRLQGQQVRYQPASQDVNHGFQDAKNAQNYQWHPVPPQVSRMPASQNREQEESPILLQVAGSVGSYLWNKATNRNNRADNIARV